MSHRVRHHEFINTESRLERCGGGGGVNELQVEFFQTVLVSAKLPHIP